MVRRMGLFVIGLGMLAAAAACGKSAASATDLLAMTVSSTNSTVTTPVGGSLQYMAIGALSDGSSATETTTATWASADPTIATVSSTGLVTGVRAGSTSISATMSGISGSAIVNVTTP